MESKYKVVKGLTYGDDIMLEDGTRISINRVKNNTNKLSVVIMRETKIGKIIVIKKPKEVGNE